MARNDFTIVMIIFKMLRMRYKEQTIFFLDEQDEV